MTLPSVDRDFSRAFLDVLIRAALIGVLAFLCYQVFSPFLALMLWAIILAVTLYPLHQWLARKVGGKEWLASTIIAILGVLLMVIPMILLISSFTDSVREFLSALETNTLHVPPPREGVENWPVIGDTVHHYWTQAYTNLPDLVQKMQPQLSGLAVNILGAAAALPVQILIFIVSFIIASIMMAYGGSGWASSKAIFRRIAGEERGETLVNLCTATIRAVALGVIGVAGIQALLVGLALLFAGVPAAGVLAVVVLVLAIAQVPAALITIPAIIYIWSSGDYTNASAIMHSIVLLLTGLSDNVLKPLMLGRGVDTPMPVILLGALGGMASGGILGMFVGAVILALGYQIFMEWVETGTDGTDTPGTESPLTIESS